MSHGISRKEIKIKLKKPVTGIYQLEFETQYEMCMTFVMLSAFYECPEFSNKFFTFEQYMDWYSKKHGKGAFTYPKDWNGFNVPGAVYRKWVKKFTEKGHYFTTKERKLIKSLDKVKDDKFYIIGNNTEPGESIDTLNHEISHGMFYLNREYKNSCLELINKLPKIYMKRIHKALDKWGYKEDVYYDETQAYLSTSPMSYLKKNKMEIPNPLYKAFKKNFKDFYTGIKRK